MEDNFKTNDMYLAAFLIVKDFRKLEIKIDERREGNFKKKCRVFVFEDQPNREELVKAYYNDTEEALVSTLRFGNALKNLKNEMYLSI